MLQAAIMSAIDRGESIYVCSEVETYHGVPIDCDGEFFTIMCEYEDEGEVSLDLWIVRMAAIVSLRKMNTTWNQERFDRIGSIESDDDDDLD